MCDCRNMPDSDDVAEVVADDDDDRVMRGDAADAVFDDTPLSRLVSVFGEFVSQISNLTTSQFRLKNISFFVFSFFSLFFCSKWI